MSRSCFVVLASLGLLISLPATETVATAIYARVGSGYSRERLKDGSFKPEYYALANGGRLANTASDVTVDRVTYPQVAEVVMRLLAQQNYRYAQTREQAKLLLVLQWGSTIAPNGIAYQRDIQTAATAYTELTALVGQQGMGSFDPGRGVSQFGFDGSPRGGADPGAIDRFEMAMLQVFANNEIRDKVNEHNARVLGYMDDLAESNDIRRWAGGGDRYRDLIDDVEETRDYIMISAYDFREISERNNRKLLWQTRVSVRAPGNRFDDSYAAMLKSAAKYFGQDSGRLVRGEEAKGEVELGNLKFLGEVKEPATADKRDGSK